MTEDWPTRYRTPGELRAVEAEHRAFLARRIIVPSPKELDREWETLLLRKQFLAVDIRVHDDWSKTGCVRAAIR
jgi:hypothetical protein